MAFTFGFYNSLNHDRMYDAVQMSQFFDGLITDGVYGTVGERFKIKTSTLNNTVVVGSGRAWFNHTWNYNDADLPITGSSPNVLYNRYDAIVIDINSDTNYRLNQIIYVTGTGSSNPVKPTMINTATHHQYPLCYIYRKTNVSTISESDIEYVVGTDECPYVESSLTDTKNIAQVELNDKASKTYSDGEYILWHDELYKVVSAISKGLNLIPYPDDGYNIRRTTITSELYGSLGLLNSVVSNSEHGVTSTGIYKALGNRTSLPTAYSAPVSGGTNLITNGQVYTALGNRERLSIETGSLENHANSWANYEIPTTYALTVAIGNKHRIIPTDKIGEGHSNPNCEYIMTSKGLYNSLGLIKGMKIDHKYIYIDNGKVTGSTTSGYIDCHIDSGYHVVSAFTSLATHPASNTALQYVEDYIDIDIRIRIMDLTTVRVYDSRSVKKAFSGRIAYYIFIIILYN